jgi:hypothetical protein
VDPEIHLITSWIFHINSQEDPTAIVITKKTAYQLKDIALNNTKRVQFNHGS